MQLTTVFSKAEILLHLFAPGCKGCTDVLYKDYCTRYGCIKCKEANNHDAALPARNEVIIQ